MQPLKGDEFSIIIPTYREALNLPILLAEIASTPFSNKSFEVIIVDDNSDDDTSIIVHELQSKYTWLTFLNRNKKRSLSHSILDGLALSHYPNLVVMDADLSHPANKIPEMLSHLEDPTVEMVIGSRYVSGGSSDPSWPLSRALLSKAAASLVRFLLALPVKDPLSGFLVFRKSTDFEEKQLQPISWKFGLEIMIKNHYQHIVEVPIHFRKRRHGTSKLTIKVMLDCLRHVFALKHKYKERNQPFDQGVN